MAQIETNSEVTDQKMDVLLDVRNLSLALPGTAARAYAIENLSLNLRRGEIHCVVGESGSGKSMTANAIMGLLPTGTSIAGGEIWLGNTDLAKLNNRQMRSIRGTRIGMIFQDPMSALNPLQRIGTQIGEMLKLHTEMRKREIQSKVLSLLEDVRISDPERAYRAYPHEVSGGQRQRAMIAMALALDPEILIADEPTTALDVTTQAQILELISDLQKRRGTGVLFITHDFGVVSEIADRVTVMQGGRMVEEGPAANVLLSPTMPYTQALMASVPTLEPKAVVPSVAPSPALVVNDLKKVYALGGMFSARKSFVALNSVSLDIPKGLTTGIVGESGSGKSTLARCVVGLMGYDAGHIDIEGFSVDKETRRTRALAKRVQMVFQDPYASLNPRHTVGDLVAQGPIVHGADKNHAMQEAQELLSLVGLDKSAKDRYPHEFSGGQRQRIALARALAMKPDLLVADEAVSALDVSIQAQILELLESVQKSLNLTILFITHDLRVTAQLCHRVAVMKSGEIVEQGWTRDVLTAPKHAYTKLLFDSVRDLRSTNIVA